MPESRSIFNPIILEGIRGIKRRSGIYENLTSPETIHRNRHKKQNDENKYKPTDTEIREYREKYSD
ncbi:MAG: hypothetical protein ACFFCS_18055 [Candidatus Hodarchaeota archaeon]